MKPDRNLDVVVGALGGVICWHAKLCTKYLEAFFKLGGFATPACDYHAQTVPHGCQTLHHDTMHQH